MSTITQVAGVDSWATLMDIVGPHAHYVVEGLLAVFILYLLFQRSYKLKETKDELTTQEIDQLVAEWRPKPLVDPELAKAANANATNKDQAALTFSSSFGAHVTVEGDDVEYVNFGSLGVLDYQAHPEVIEAAVATLKVNGVGACGPRGFYGTVDVHMDLEAKIARFMGFPEACLYSSGFATLASVIPAFSKPTDFLIVDKGVSLSAQVGATISRSRVSWFNHNDINDLKRILETLKADNVFDGTKRVFCVIEGIYINIGDLCPLPEIMKLKQEYPFRLIIDESCSIGVLGKTGRGVTEHFGVPTSEVDMITASIGNSIGSIGGFACGDEIACSHQRLNSSSYVFSCSLPPFSASAASKAFELIEKGVELSRLQKNVTVLHDALKGMKNVVYTGASTSPLVHLRLKKSAGERNDNEQALQDIIDTLRTKHRIIAVRSKYVQHEKFLPAPSIRFVISANHTKEEIESAIAAIDAAAAN